MNPPAYVFDPSKNIIAAPSDPALWPDFRAKLTEWRAQTRNGLNYDDTLYSRPDFTWASSSYACYFLMIYDETFYDVKTGRYQLDKILEEGDLQFGGYDSLVLWHAYPRIGVDQRNQFDFYRDMPAGIPGVRDLVRDLHARGVQVYINYNPWDTATRREGRSDLELLTEMVGAIEVDGIFLDTMTHGGAEFRANLDAVRPGVILEGEGTPPQAQIADHHASWAQWFDDSEVPGVLRHKWFERRHMQHQTQRWNSDHTTELHTAWMNGSGMMIWENVFGAWVPWNARDRSFLRAILPIQRRYSALFSSENWTPLVPVEHSHVYASLWTGDGVRLWTLINRAEYPVEGELLKIDCVDGERYFDLVAGCELAPFAVDDRLSVSLSIPARGPGCLLGLPGAQVTADFEAFLTSQALVHARADYDTATPRRTTHRLAVERTPLSPTVPSGMVVPPVCWKKYLSTQIRIRECGLYDATAIEETPFRDSYQFQVRDFLHPVQLSRYAMDETPVTNAQFAKFLNATGYRPPEPENFLKHWNNGQIPFEKEDHPVVWISLKDARSYATWAGKRLPTEDEWQHAAQEGDGREYPWGNGLRTDVCNLGETGDTTPVKAFPKGRTPSGIYDLCGNVWQWTESEASEGRTRYGMIRGGSHFAAQGSLWYVDGGPRPASFTTKFLLMWPGLDRCATVGFRCVVDLA